MEIISAWRSPTLHRPSRSQKPGIVLGLRYERRFIKTLKSKAASSRRFCIEPNPWFAYIDSEGVTGAASPDAILIDKETNTLYVIEIKYTWVPTALVKLRNLYCPLVTLVENRETKPIVVARRLTPDSPEPSLDFLDSPNRPGNLFQWLEHQTFHLKTF